MANINIETKFRKTSLYTMEMLIRDLLDVFQEVDPRVAADVTQWTPALRFAGGNTGITYVTQRGNCQKIGRLVFLDFEIKLSSKGTSVGNAYMTGLPYLHATSRPAAGVIQWYGGFVLTASTVLGIHGYGHNGGDWAALVMHGASTTSVTDTHMTNNSRFIGSMSYLAAE